MRKILFTIFSIIFLGLYPGGSECYARQKQSIRALYLPLADHYPGIVAYEKYRGKMRHADYTIERMDGLLLVRARFRSDDVDVAFNVAPMVMDMFSEKPDFRWVSLIHRDGNALAINKELNAYVHLPAERKYRKADGKVAEAYSMVKKETGEPCQCAVPSLLATQTVVLYKYLRDNGKTLGLGFSHGVDVIAIEVPPPESPSFIKKRSTRRIPASFEQSLPWADLVETLNFGYVAWYSKEVMKWPGGHVECVIIAKDSTIKNKTEALREVIHYIHRAGIDIEEARNEGGQALKNISNMIRRHIPEHTHEAIAQSLRPDLYVINYKNLNRICHFHYLMNCFIVRYHFHTSCLASSVPR